MTVKGSHYDYTRQAWTVDGRYIRCGYPESMACNCYGKAHAGELAPIENLPTALETGFPVASESSETLLSRVTRFCNRKGV